MDENKSITYDDPDEKYADLKIYRTIFRRSDTKAACHADPADGMEKCHSSFLQTGEQHGGLFSACRYQTAGCNA